jgi:hypothetical protein
MAPGLPRARFNSSGLVRVLADMAIAELPETGQTLGERLGLWLGWTDAIALATALGGTAAQAPASARAAPTAQALAQDMARVRGQLALAISQDEQLQADPAANPPDNVADFSPYRRSYLAHQSAMDAAIPALRARLRAALAARSAALGQLAALDAVMDQALAERERQALAGVPRLLEQRYQRLRTSHPEPQRRYRQDMQDVLRAELELRLQPVQGLMEALSHENNSLP